MKLKIPHNFLVREKWKACYYCEPELRTVIAQFTSGSTAPATGETLTGATSSDTGVVVASSVSVISGSWAGGDAAGYVELSSPSGVEDGAWGTASELINGSTGGSNIMTLTQGSEIVAGFHHPKSNMIKYDGRWMCREHFHFYHDMDWVTDTKIDVSESERGKE